MANDFVVYRLDIDNKRSIKSMQDLIDYQKELRKRILQATDTGTKEYKELEGAIKRNHQQILTFNRNLRNSGSLAQGVTRGMINAFKRVGVFIAASFSINAIVNFGRAIDELTLNMEKGFARVNTVAQVSQQELDGIRERAIALGKDSGVALEQIPDALFDILSGTGDVEVSFDLLESSLKATDAGFGNLNETAKAGIDIYNAVKNEVDSTEEVFDVLFQTQKQGVTDISQLAAALPSVIPSAQALGLNFREVSAALATLTKAGINTAESGTALTRFFGTLAKRGKQVEQVLGRGSVYDEATGNILPLVDIIKNLADNFSTLSDEARSDLLNRTGLTNLSSRKAIISLVNNLGTLEDLDLDIAVNSVGELNRQLEFSDNSTRQLTKAQNELKAKLLEVGTEAAPTVTKAKIFLIETFISLIDTGQGVIRFFQENDGAMKALLVTMGLFVSFLAGRMIPIVGTTIKSLAGWLLNLRAVTVAQTAAAAAAGRFSLSIRILTRAIASNPVGLIITGVTTLLTLLPLFSSAVTGVNDELEQTVDLSKEFTAKVGEQQGALNALFEELKNDNTSRERKNEIMKEINSKYGKYLPFLLTEETSLEKIKEAQRKANDELFRSIALKTQQEEIGKIIQERIEREKNALLALGDASGSTQSELLDAIALSEKLGVKIEDLAVAENIQAIFGSLEEGGAKFSEEFTEIFNSLTEEELQVIRNLENISINLKSVGIDAKEFSDLVIGGSVSTAEVLDVLINKRNEEGDAISRLLDFYRNLQQQRSDADDEDLNTSTEVVDAKKRQSLELQKLKAEEALLNAKTVDEEIEAERRLYDIKQQILNQEIAAVKGKSDKELEERQELNNKKIKLEQEFDRDIDALENQRALFAVQSQIEGFKKEVDQARFEFETKLKPELERQGQSRAQIDERRRKAIGEAAQKFLREQIEDEQEAALRQLEIERNLGNEQLQLKESFERAKLEVVLAAKEKELALLERIGIATKEQLTQLKQEIELIKSELGVATTEEVDSQLGKRADEAAQYIGYVGNVISSIDNAISSFAQSQIAALDQRITGVTDRISILQNRIAEIDDLSAGATAAQIERNEREKRSLRAKILDEQKQLEELEKQKERQQKEEARRKKTFGIVQAIINTALAVTEALPDFVSAGIAAALGAVEIAVIAAQPVAKGGLLDPDKFPLIKYATGGPVQFPAKKGGMINGPLHRDGGVPFTISGNRAAEAEGGEFITSRVATNMFLPVFDYLNAFANRMSKTRFSHSSTVPRIARYEAGGSVLGGTGETVNVLNELRAIKDAVSQNRKVVLSLAELKRKEAEYDELEVNANE